MSRAGVRASTFARLLSCALGVAGFFATTAHAADTRERDECVAAAENGQVLRDRNRFVDANDAFSRCARATCPAVVKQDCARWLVELQDKTPSVTLRAQDEDGKDVADVVATMDGAPFAGKLDGSPFAVDPGEHSFHAEAPGYVAVDQRAVFLAGDRSRAIALLLKRAAPKAEPSGPGLSPTTPDAAHSHGALPWVAWVSGGVAVAALATGAAFGLTALNQRQGDFAPGGCAPRCSPDEADGIHTRLVVADVTAGVGLAAAALAVYAFVASRDHSAHPPPVQLSATGLRVAF